MTEDLGTQLFMQRANLERDARERQKAEKPERYHISGKHGRTIGPTFRTSNFTNMHDLAAKSCDHRG